MKKDNSKASAMPWVLQHGFHDYEKGLTKREMFAMSAPEAPSWFKNKLHADDVNYRQEESKSASDGANYLFFAWRTYYADALLSELERKK